MLRKWAVGYNKSLGNFLTEKEHALFNKLMKTEAQAVRQRNSWEENLEELCAWVKEHGTLPKSTANMNLFVFAKRARTTYQNKSLRGHFNEIIEQKLPNILDLEFGAAIPFEDRAGN